MKNVCILLSLLGYSFTLTAQSLDRIVISSGGHEIGAPGATAGAQLSSTFGEPLIASFQQPNGILTIGFQQGYTQGASLPVEWLAVNVTWEGQWGLIEWLVAEEVNNHHFEIERSLDGQSFQPIGTALSHPDDPAYRFIDSLAFNQALDRLYYRIKQVDLDGSFSFSNVVLLEKRPETALQGIIFPNPAQDQAWLRLTGGNNETVSVELLSIEGRSLWFRSQNRTSLPNEIELPMQHLHPGHYVLRVVQVDTVLHFKIVVSGE